MKNASIKRQKTLEFNKFIYLQRVYFTCNFFCLNIPILKMSSSLEEHNEKFYEDDVKFDYNKTENSMRHLRLFK